MRFTLASAALIASMSVAHAQSWMYSTTGQGAPPFMYNGGQLNYGPSSTYNSAPLVAPSLPEVPEVRSYVPDPPSGPTAFPCTFPQGCD